LKGIPCMITFFVIPCVQVPARNAPAYTTATAQSKSTRLSRAVGANRTVCPFLHDALQPSTAGSCIASAKTSGFDICSPTTFCDSTGKA
jgi:hypothetical protein